jgi:hypothetical protein
MNKQKLQNLYEDPEKMAMEIDKAKDERDDKLIMDLESSDSFQEYLEKSGLEYNKALEDWNEYWSKYQ